MKQSYYISSEHKIESTEEGHFTHSDLSLALAAMTGWTFKEKTPLNDAIITRTYQDGKQEVRFIPELMSASDVQKHAQTYGLHPLMPMQSLEFAQSIMTNFPCVVSAITSHAGELRGLWRVESLSGWQAADITKSGLHHGSDEYVETVSTVLPEAICLNALARAGMGKRAYFYYTGMSVENAELIYLGERSLEVVSTDAEFMLHLIPAPTLDEYALLPAPEDLMESEREHADAQAVIKKVELKKIMDARAEAEAEAEATKLDQPKEGEAVTPAEPELVEEPAQVEEPEQAEPEVKPESV